MFFKWIFYADNSFDLKYSIIIKYYYDFKM